MFSIKCVVCEQDFEWGLEFLDKTIHEVIGLGAKIGGELLDHIKSKHPDFIKNG